MLKLLRLENFKSYKGRHEFSLPAITVLAGANSSGKSTVIQAILVIKQTLQNAPAQRAIALNGPIVRLGRFDDVKNVQSPEGHFGLGFQISNDERFPTADVQTVYGRYEYVDDPVDVSVFATFSAGLTPENEEVAQLHPRVLASEISFNPDEDTETSDPEGNEESNVSDAEMEFPFERRYISVKRTADGRESKKFRAGVADIPEAIGYFLDYDLLDADQNTKDEVEEYPEAEIIGVGIRKFFPSSLAIAYNETRWRAMHVAEEILRGGVRTTRVPADLQVPGQLADLIAARLVDLNAELKGHPQRHRQAPTIEKNKEGNVLLSDLQRFIRQMIGSTQHTPYYNAQYNYSGQYMPRRTARERHLATVVLRECYDEIVTIVERNQPPKRSVTPLPPSGLRRAIGSATRYFSEFVKYLGPLRDEPRPLYPLEPLANPTDVGFKGEHTAAVLDLNRDRVVETVSPASFLSGETTETLRLRLSEAVAEWLSYLGVVEGVVTKDLGKIGHELQVRRAGIDKSHDLTNVGVGVSQVIPIVVMALLAEKGSLLIFEQPELHLHPKVQARLGDFFMSLSFLGKQCVVETHSEYLIRRFRRRVVEGHTQVRHDDIAIYYFEQQSGVTHRHLVQVNEYGAIENWPEDFFDQAADETEKIISAAARKRRERQLNKI